MLNKEEIKNIKELKDMLDYASMCVHSNLQLDNESSKLLCTYIEQLETNNKKLIEKLEEDISKFNTYRNMHQLSQKGQGALDYAQEILKIAKGEKE